MSAALPSDLGNLAPEARGRLWDLVGASRGRVALSLAPEDALEVLAMLDHRLRNLKLMDAPHNAPMPLKLRRLRSGIATALARVLDIKPSTNGRPF